MKKQTSISESPEHKALCFLYDDVDPELMKQPPSVRALLRPSNNQQKMVLKEMIYRLEEKQRARWQNDKQK